ncbi:MAG: PorV/PorQ family protein [Bacteroidota bacterium]
MKHSKFLIILFISLFVLQSEMGTAQTVSKVGTTSASFLTLPVGARSSAMAANVASVNDLSSMYWNPAGLSDVKTPQVMLEYTDWLLDFNHTFLGASIPVAKGSVGFHVLALDFGSFDETTVEANGKTGRTFNAYSISTGVTFSQYLIPEFTIGGTVKFIYERISENSASAIAFDVGTIYRTPFDDIKLGVSITNLGPEMRMMGTDNIVRYDPIEGNLGEFEPDAELSTEGFPLPLNLRVGLSWEAYNEKGNTLVLGIDGTSPNDNFQSVSFGGEFATLDGQLMFRGGVPYAGLSTTDEQFTLGFGLNYKLSSRYGMRLDYSYHAFELLSNVNKISVQLQF